jgi:hypothetical protein
LDEFHKNLKLNNIGVNLQKDLDFDLITHVELEVFGKIAQNGWKLKPNEHLKLANCGAL